MSVRSAAMDTAPTRKQQTHERIVETAARAIRSHGLHGVGVADIMKQVGLTHGGFYAHFASKDALLAEALERAGQDSRERLQRSLARAGARGGSRFRSFVESYLSDRHLASCETGCPVAALASEIPRQSGDVRTAATGRVKSLLATVRDCLPPEQPDEAAAVVASQLVGALQLARALGENTQGRRHLAAVRGHLLAQFDSARG